jgi:hypothetical protein
MLSLSKHSEPFSTACQGISGVTPAFKHRPFPRLIVAAGYIRAS